ncbi:hypothetical protein LXL04_039095 [Taraxacum kok-saghyz]
MVLTIRELRKGLKHPDLDKAYEVTDNYFTLKLHYGGVFTKVLGRKYINGNVAYFDFVGRPKKKRKRGVDEARDQTSNLSRRYVSVTCAKCGNKCHNSRTCKGQGELVNPELLEDREVC